MVYLLNDQKLNESKDLYWNGRDFFVALKRHAVAHWVNFRPNTTIFG